jgi:hypothetical protein
MDKSKGKTKSNSQDNELMRFGHTVTLSKIKFNLVNKQQAVLFGGAKGTSTKYDICDDSYLFKIDEHIWIKLNRKVSLI